MVVFVRKISPNDDSPDFDFIEAQVVFHDDAETPHNRAAVSIYLKKNERLTFEQVVEAAVEKARQFLLFAGNFPRSEYHRKIF